MLAGLTTPEMRNTRQHGSLAARLQRATNDVFTNHCPHSMYLLLLGIRQHRLAAALSILDIMTSTACLPDPIFALSSITRLSLIRLAAFRLRHNTTNKTVACHDHTG